MVDADAETVIAPFVKDRGYDWEISIDETPCDLWSLQGELAPPFESVAEKRWVKENKASPYTLTEKLPVNLLLAPGVADRSAAGRAYLQPEHSMRDGDRQGRAISHRPGSICQRRNVREHLASTLLFRTLRPTRKSKRVRSGILSPFESSVTPPNLSRY
ncbi:MAG: tautomerase family protein [Nitrospira sp.]